MPNFEFLSLNLSICPLQSQASDHLDLSCNWNLQLKKVNNCVFTHWLGWEFPTGAGL